MDGDTTTAVLMEFARRIGLFAYMNSTWGWPIVEVLHFLSLATLLGTVGLFDLRLLGLARSVPIPHLQRLAPLGAAAFGVNVVTGAMFFLTAADQYLYNPAFQLKCLCIAIAGVNLIFFYSVCAKRVRSLELGASVPILARIAAGVSLAFWLAVITLGRLITYFRPPYHWCGWCA